MSFNLLPNLKLVASAKLTDVITAFNRLYDNLTSLFQTFSNKPQITNTNIIENILLKAGSNQIKTGLNTPLTGWYVIRKRGPGDIWDLQDTNKNSANYLTLYSTIACNIDLLVF